MDRTSNIILVYCVLVLEFTLWLLAYTESVKIGKISYKNREEILCAFDNADEFEKEIKSREIINLLQRLDPPTILTNADYGRYELDGSRS